MLSILRVGSDPQWPRSCHPLDFFPAPQCNTHGSQIVHSASSVSRFNLLFGFFLSRWCALPTIKQKRHISFTFNKWHFYHCISLLLLLFNQYHINKFKSICHQGSLSHWQATDKNTQMAILIFISKQSARLLFFHYCPLSYSNRVFYSRTEI